MMEENGKRKNGSILKEQENDGRKLETETEKWKNFERMEERKNFRFVMNNF